MANQKRWYYGQLVYESDLNEAFRDLEIGSNNILVDQGLVGVLRGFTVGQQPTPNMSVIVEGSSVAYDQQGRRCFLPTPETVDLSQDSDGVPTAVINPGNVKWLTIFVQFERQLSDLVPDDNNNLVYFREDEGMKFVVVQGPEAALGSETRPAKLDNGLLIADVLIEHGTTAILEGTGPTSVPRIETDNFQLMPDSRFDSPFRLQFNDASGGGVLVNANSVTEAIQQITNVLNQHIAGTAFEHPPRDEPFNGGPNWADGTTNPPITPLGEQQTLNGQIAKMIEDLATTDGSDKIRHTMPAWRNGFTGDSINSSLLGTSVGGIVRDLSSRASRAVNGANKIGFRPDTDRYGTAWDELGFTDSEDVHDAVHNILNILSSNNGGSTIGQAATAAWRDGSVPGNNIGVTNLTALSDQIVEDLADLQGATRVGVRPGNPGSGGQTTIQGALDYIFNRFQSTKADLSADNTITGKNTFQDTVVLGGANNVLANSHFSVPGGGIRVGNNRTGRRYLHNGIYGSQLTGPATTAVTLAVPLPLYAFDAFISGNAQVTVASNGGIGNTGPRLGAVWRVEFTGSVSSGSSEGQSNSSNIHNYSSSPPIANVEAVFSGGNLNMVVTHNLGSVTTDFVYYVTWDISMVAVFT